MRGRYTVGDNQVAWFGVKMISTWQAAAGQTLEGTMAVAMDFAHGTPKVSFAPTVSITSAHAPMPASPGTSSRSVDGSGLANVGGVVQSVQVAGDDNLASNETRLTVSDGGAVPADATAASGAANPVASAYGDGASAVSRFDGKGAAVLLTIDGQGAVAQWIRDGSVGQTIQLAADGQQVSNRMEIELVRQSVAANAQLAQNVAQSMALARGIGLR